MKRSAHERRGIERNHSLDARRQQVLELFNALHHRSLSLKRI